MASRVIKDEINSKLNDKQRLFCIEYLKDLNGLQAYKRAYGEELDDNTCKVNASKLLTNANVKKYINDLLDEYRDNIDVTVGEIVANIKTMAFDKDARYSDRIKASELLAKYKQMLIEKKEITVNDNNINITLEDE
ncbi:terminase small subunit [uncultured Clostridium sp.]|uniref:terminase small subunit n=1 Tax=uncultured Clostridium sp. TaxID=59620 RepID=UPI0028EA5C8C|nr:terminase small subunit [uncultured Clostridium sp.]